MVVGRQKLLSLAVLSGLGVDTVRGGYHLPRNATVSSIPAAHSQSTTVGSDETHISLSSVGSTVEVTSAYQTSTALETQTVGVESVNFLQPNTQDASESPFSAPPISTVPTEFDPSSAAPPGAVLSTFTIVVSPSFTDPSDDIKTSASTFDYSSRIDKESSTITTGPLPSASDFTSSSSLAWNYAPVGQKSESPGQNDATPTVGAVPGGIVVIPPDIPPWVEQTASSGEDVSLGQPPLETLPGGIVNLPPDIPPWVEQTASSGEDVSLGQPPLETLPGGIVNLPPDIPPWVEQTASSGDEVSLGQPPVEIPTSWDYVPATTTSGFTSTQNFDATSTRGQLWNQTTAPYYNQSSTWSTSGSVTRSSVFPNTTTMLSSSTISHCQPSDLTATVTSWEVVHISTITWIGNPANYTQPYPTLIPPPVETIPPCIDLVTRTTPPPGITLTTCFTVTASGSETKSCTLTVSTNSWGYGPQTSTTIRFAPTVTFITTDKNPAVVYSPIQTPNYGVTNDITKPPRPTAVSVDPVDPPVYNTFHSNNSPGEVTKPAPKPVTVIVKPTEVIIGSSTITDNPTTKTQTVVVGGETFTVGPTQVIGVGATVTRPSTSKGGGAGGAGAGGIIYAPVPTSTKLNDLPIIVSSSVAVIGTGSSTFTLPPTPTTVVVEDHTISIGPSGIAIIDRKGNPIIATVTIPPPSEQTITIGPGSNNNNNNNNNEPKTTTVDGLPITIISSSVAIIGVGTASSTLTFPASGSSPTTITIDNGGHGHTLTVGPSGLTLTAPLPPNALATTSSVITIQTLSMPLPSVTSLSQPPSTATEVVVAGGSLVTAIGRSVVVIYGTTITYTTLSSPFTTVIDGEDTIVLDPSAGVLITHHNHPAPGATAGPGGAGVTVTTLGGPNANPSATEFAVVGGATITKVGASVVVVEGVTYTVGPSLTGTGTGDTRGTGGTGGKSITTVLSGNGQTVTIGPEGVVVGTMTISFPFNGGDGGDGGSSTTVIFPGAGGGAGETATATAAGASGSGSAKGGDDDNEDVGVALGVVWRVMMLGLGVAGAVGVFGL